MYKGCRVLDIGCGDGFFDYLFYSGLAGHIDALDIEPSAIARARKYHQANNITYYIRDGIKQEFPNESYDVVVFDGSIGHFTEDEIATIMSRIHQVLGEGGILVGAEALEPVGKKGSGSSYWDHYRGFPELVDLKDFLNPFFTCVLVKEIPAIRGRYREAYFRCGHDLERLRGYSWQ
jgi:SAM-dependent methyltransferase